MSAMTGIKKAKVQRCDLFEFTCPHCGESAESPSGALTWLDYEIDRIRGTAQKCFWCCKEYEVPAKRPTSPEPRATRHPSSEATENATR